MQRITNKVLSLISVVSVFLSAASGCSSSVGIADVDNVDLAVADIYDWTDKNFHNLSADGSLQVSDTIDSDKDFILPRSLGTNSTKITVANNSEAAVTVYLCYDGDTDNPIQQFSLGRKERKSFANLTSRFSYSISMSADVGTQLSLTITD